jgi:hypothetical protein
MTSCKDDLKLTEHDVVTVRNQYHVNKIYKAFTRCRVINELPQLFNYNVYFFHDYFLVAYHLLGRNCVVSSTEAISTRIEIMFVYITECTNLRQRRNFPIRKLSLPSEFAIFTLMMTQSFT